MGAGKELGPGQARVSRCQVASARRAWKETREERSHFPALVSKGPT